MDELKEVSVPEGISQDAEGEWAADLENADSAASADGDRTEVECSPRSIYTTYSCRAGTATTTTYLCVHKNCPAYTARIGFYNGLNRIKLSVPYVRHASAYPGNWIGARFTTAGIPSSVNRIVVYWWCGDIYDPPMETPPVSKWYSVPRCS